MTLHLFPPEVCLDLPAKFTYPFYYTPHPLCLFAAEEVKRYVARQEAWQAELKRGKMFGVLVVQTPQGVGFLAAFSGILAGENRHPYFVPPVYDLLQPDGFFKAEEQEISDINRRIKQLETDEELQCRKQELAELEAQAKAFLAEAKLALKQAKAKREAKRASTPSLSPEEEQALIRESQFQKAEYKRQERAWQEKIAQAKALTAPHEETIETLKQERKRRSGALQQRLFEQFKMLNARGEVKDLCTIFAPTPQQTPPAGSGECCAPKLLQYAYLQHWKPLAMAEFWWGDSPKTEIRHHGDFYPACKGKCEPILAHMLQGLTVEENLLLQRMQTAATPLSIVYEDDYLVVVDKPAGMLSVPGKEAAESVYSLLRERYPQADGPLLVHRLDMATSGLLLAAKSKQIHQQLQAQFKNRSIEKRYIALVEGTPPHEQGTISLPLCLDPNDRPRQQVCYQHGKPAITRYEVLSHEGDYTRIAFYPHTGRTHQLRVHAAHPDGLGCPIVGDELYGHKGERLCLHAEMLEFTHPVTGERKCIKLKIEN